MKKYIFPLLVLALYSLSGTAQIKGHFPNKNATKWSLSNMEGVNIPLNPDTLGNFKLDISRLEKGMYRLGNIEVLYLEPDYNLEIIPIESGYTFKGKGSIENNQIEQSKLPLRPLRSTNGMGLPMSAFLMEPDQFIAIVDEYKKSADQLFSSSKNSLFRSLLIPDAGFVRINLIKNFTMFYGMDSLKTRELNALLKTPLSERKPDHSALVTKAYRSQFVKVFSLKESEMINDIIYKHWDMNMEELFKNSIAYRTAITNRINYSVNAPINKKLLDSLKNSDLLKLHTVSKEISNDYIASSFNYQYTGSIIKKARNTADVQALYHHFMNTSNYDFYKEGIETLYNNLKATEKTVPAPGFSFINSEDKFVTLESLRGKYVYIDIWATWCIPCIMEIPDLKKLEERYKDKKIHFVSLSVDKAADKDKWLKFVKEHHLKGIQLMADKDFNSDFIKKFGVNAIPRFLLIGPDGSIVENDAKRPSDTALSAQLEKLLH